jgi:outer membrane protein OmpA-like peptidoglycan-associated protein
MMGMASEVIAGDPRTEGVMILQLTWSAGDHLVAREGIRTVADLKGKTIVLQQGGPHVGMVDDILRSARLTWDDISVVWAEDLTASDKSPAAIFRARPDIAAAAVISPDMFGMTGDLLATGTGADGTIKGARVLVSTAEMSRSIADVYMVRKDFYDANPDVVRKFVLGYMQGSEAVVALKKAYENGGSQPYVDLLKMAQNIYGKEVLPTIEEDAHGLVLDASLVGYPGNVVFFRDEKALSGFANMRQQALNLALDQGYAAKESPWANNTFAYEQFKSDLTKTDTTRTERFRAEAVVEEIESLTQEGGLDDRTILAFTINFAPNQTEFKVADYAEEYQRLVELADKYGSAAIAIRGHADPTKTLLDTVRAGMSKGLIKRTGNRGNYSYSFKGRPLDLNATKELVKLIAGGELDGGQHNPRQTMQAARNLSRARAQAVRDSVISFASGKGLYLDQSQVQPVGVGIAEPFIAKPANKGEAAQNMRVEFRLIRVQAETSSDSDFDF